MNAAELWNDHTFHVLLDDLVKARKSESDGSSTDDDDEEGDGEAGFAV